MTLLSIEDIRAAAARIAPYVLRTPTLRAEARPDLVVWVKAECLQPIGAFKIRGAFSMMTRLHGVDGVVAHSSGNHAQAVARAARVLGLRAAIVMPSDAPPLKRERVAADGAEIVTVGTDSEERRLEAVRLSEERGWPLVPPYDHPLIAAGQGTAALELHEDAPELDAFFCPVSGGGLMAGCATALQALRPGCALVGVEPEDANDTSLSLAAGRRVAVEPPKTIADGLRVRIPGEWTWTVNRDLIQRVAVVSDDEMRAAMRWAAHNLRIVLEPSGAAALAAALRDGRGNVAVLASGGNVDPAMFVDVLA